MQIVDEGCETKNWHRSKRAVIRRLAAYATHANRVYIGYTRDVGQRAKSHEREKPWARRMILLWRSRTPTWGEIAEQQLIEHALAAPYRYKVDNLAPGGEGVTAGGVLYLLVDTAG